MTMFFGAKNAADGAGASVRGGYADATPDEATGYPGSNLLLEAPAAYWRSTLPVAGALVRFGQDRSVGSLAAGPHVCTRHARWRSAHGTTSRPAIRPAISTDGVDDDLFATGLTQTADQTFIGNVTIPAQPVSNNTIALLLAACGVAATNRWEISVRVGSGASPYYLAATTRNHATAVTATSAIRPDGGSYVIAYRYTDATKLFELLLDGVVVASGTAAAAWVDSGAEAVRLGRSNLGGTGYSRAIWQGAALYNRALSNAEIAAWEGEIPTGARNGLIEAWPMTEGTGATAAGVLGLSNMAITGATWVAERVPAGGPVWTTDGAVWGPWSSRQALKLQAGVYAQTPDLGSEPRNATLACTILWRADDPIVDGGVIGWIGATKATSCVRLETTAAGKVLARSLRNAGNVTVTSDAALNDGTTYFVRAVIDGMANTLSLYVGSDGVAEASQGTPATPNAYSTVATCYHTVGNGGLGAEVGFILVADARAYSAVVLEADDPMTTDTAPWVRGAFSFVNLDGAVVDAVDSTRVFTAGTAPTYGRIYQTEQDSLEGASALYHDDADDPFVGYQHLLLAPQTTADVTASEVWIEIADPTGPGYVQVGTVHAASTVRPPRGVDLDGQARRHTAPAVVRSARSGSVALGEGYSAWGFTGRLRIETGRTTATLLNDAQEFEARLVRRLDPSKLVAVWALPKATVPAHRYIEHVVVGVYKPEGAGVADIVFDSFPIVVDGVL